MTRGIYCYIDKKNNEMVYVGKDSSIHEDKRHGDHFKPSKYAEQQINRVLQNNPDRYTYQVLNFDVGDEDTLNALEIQYIRQLKPMFNFTEGGDGTSGYKFTEEQKEKISGENHPFFGIKRPEHSERMKKKWEDEEYRKNISESHKGKKHPKETRRKISEKAKERWEDEEYHKMMIKNHADVSGKNNPRAKYNLWDISYVSYLKGNMFKNNRNPNPCRCFRYKYNGYHLPISYFHDFVTPQIINDLISDAID